MNEKLSPMNDKSSPKTETGANPMEPQTKFVLPRPFPSMVKWEPHRQRRRSNGLPPSHCEEAEN